MKNSILKIILLLIISSSSCFGQSPKLPVPSKSFLNASKRSDHADVEYFSKYIGKVSRKILKKVGDANYICSSFYTFKNNITLKNDSCSEVGIEAQIIFPGYEKKEIIKFVEWFFRTEDNRWNATKTKYDPKDEEAGCYVEIKELKGRIVLNYYCGC